MELLLNKQAQQKGEKQYADMEEDISMYRPRSRTLLLYANMLMDDDGATVSFSWFQHTGSWFFTKPSPLTQEQCNVHRVKTFAASS